MRVERKDSKEEGRREMVHCKQMILGGERQKLEQVDLNDGKSYIW